MIISLALPRQDRAVSGNDHHHICQPPLVVASQNQSSSCNHHEYLLTTLPSPEPFVGIWCHEYMKLSKAEPIPSINAKVCGFLCSSTIDFSIPKYPFAIETPTRSRGQSWISQWIETSYAVISSALEYQKLIDTTEILVNDVTELLAHRFNRQTLAYHRLQLFDSTKTGYGDRSAGSSRDAFRCFGLVTRLIRWPLEA